MKRAVLLGTAATATVLAWTAASSLVLLRIGHVWTQFPWPEKMWQWWNYLLYGQGGDVAGLLKQSGMVGVAAVAIAAALPFAQQRQGPSLRRSWFRTDPQLMRGTTDNHGHAEWPSVDKVRQMYSGRDPIFGGVVIGEAYRPSQDKVANVPFNPRDSKTWGKGGKAPLLIDDCSEGPTHNITFAGPGNFKTSRAVSTLLTWSGPAVVLDPSTELGPMLVRTREDMGQEVFCLSLEEAEDVGFNVLDWIDIDAPMAETNVHAVVGWVCGERANVRGGDANDFFDKMGRLLIACLLADMLWDRSLSWKEKTLRRLRAALVTPEAGMRVLLRRLASSGFSTMSRQFASTLMELVPETFSGIYANANSATSWLSNPAFADLVSGSSFRTRDIARERMTVFLQIPLKALMSSPSIGRCVIGALLNAVYEADGDVPHGRVLFLLDEVARLGFMKALLEARDVGRKYGVTLALFYQSVGQMLEQWGPDEKRSWYDGVSWRAYSALQDLDTAKELSAEIGTYGVLASSEGQNSGTQAGTKLFSNASRGKNQNVHEIKRALISPDELLNDTRTDAVFVKPRGWRPFECGAAIYWRRPEMVARVDGNRFHTRRAS